MSLGITKRLPEALSLFHRMHVDADQGQLPPLRGSDIGRLIWIKAPVGEGR
jgi:hypothetical protein